MIRLGRPPIITQTHVSTAVVSVVELAGAQCKEIEREI